MKSLFKKTRIIVVLPIFVLIAGTIGFILLEDLSFLDAVYLTIVTISTVGYGDIHPVTTAGKIFGIIIIFFGIGSFLTIVTNLTQSFISRGQDKIRKQRLNMIVGVFFTEIGFELLRLLAKYDVNVDTICDDCRIEAHWTDSDFQKLRRKLLKHTYTTKISASELDVLQNFLVTKSDILLRQLENDELLEHESFTELLWAVVHLRDELIARKTFKNLPEADLQHLSNDISRIYSSIVKQWLQYLRHLKTNYPFLFSLALRTNPFTASPSAIIEDTKQ